VAEPRAIRLGDRDIPYLLKRSQRRRTVVFIVDEDGLAVHAPWRSTQARIDRALREAADWVLRKLETWSRRQRRAQRWANGVSLPFLGRELALEVEDDSVATTAILLAPQRLRVTVPGTHGEAAVREAVVSWYRRHATSHFVERVAHYAQRLSLEPPRLFLSNARTQWGSCNVKREVRLNWRLIQAPQTAIDYVVVHELAHLIELNHSRRFWRVVERAFPDHRAARAHLNEKGRWYLDI